LKYYIKLAVNLMIVCAVAAAALSLTYSLTKKAIAEQAKQRQIDANKAVMPEATGFASIKKPKTGNVATIYEAKKDDAKLGYVVLVNARGYGGTIEMVVGVDLAGKVTNISIISQRETPGLGDGIVAPKWNLQFKGKTVDDKLEVNKDIDSLTGATISSKAVTAGVKEALKELQQAGK